ncbi:unknown [Firmicutes bacterium CAG:137]|nr:unknown [Firmicutes bacterium CAG:137]
MNLETSGDKKANPSVISLSMPRAVKTSAMALAAELCPSPVLQERMKMRMDELAPLNDSKYKRDPAWAGSATLFYHIAGKNQPALGQDAGQTHFLFPYWRRSASTWGLVRTRGVRGGTAKAVPCAVHLDHSQSSPSRYAYAPRGRQGAAAPVQVVIFDALRVLQTGPSVNSL